MQKMSSAFIFLIFIYLKNYTNHMLETVPLCVTCGLSPKTSLKKSPPSPLYKRTGKCSTQHVARPNTRFLRDRVALFALLHEINLNKNGIAFLCGSFYACWLAILKLMLTQKKTSEREGGPLSVSGL